VKPALAAMFHIGWGSSTKPLKGDPNYISYPNFGSNWPITRFYFISGTNFSSFSYDGDHFDNLTAKVLIVILC
jgi:hypothetical protein